jgi:peptidyl-prolyl cis-trans isomerase-like 2
LCRPTERYWDSYQDPFEEYKTRLAKKLAHRVEAETNPTPKQSHKEGDDVNWFGVKLGPGATDAVLDPNESGVAGIGKYLDLKRPRDEPTGPNAPEGTYENKKRKKVGFGNFEGW